MTKSIDPAQIVYDFAIGLPNPIKKEILLFVVLYAMAFGTRSEFDEKLRNFLLAPPLGPEKFSAVIRTIAALDYVLASRTGSRAAKKAKLEFVKEALPSSKEVEIALLALPFAHKHFEQALAEWQTLRGATLTLQNLEDFEDRCLNPLYP